LQAGLNSTMPGAKLTPSSRTAMRLPSGVVIMSRDHRHLGATLLAIPVMGRNSRLGAVVVN